MIQELSNLLLTRAWLMDERVATILYHQVMGGKLSLIQAKTAARNHAGIIQGERIGTYANVRKVKHKSGAYVAVMPVLGTLTKRGELCSYGMRDYQNELYTLRDNEEISAIVMDTEGPGGTVDGTNEFGMAVREVKATKPIVTFGDNMVASANYWVASQSSWIVGNKNNPTEFGSIGVLCVHEYWGKFIEENIGEIKIIRAPQSVDKARVNPLEALTPDIEKEIIDDLKGCAKEFFSAVKKGRGDRLTADEKTWGTGKMYKLPEALDLGLIDSIDTLQGAINKAVELSTTSKSKSSNKQMSLKKVVSSFMSKKSDSKKKAAATPAAAEPQGVAWAEELVFNTDGSGDGATCNHPDTNGTIRNFETKVDNNQGNEPPTDPEVTEDDNWALLPEEEPAEETESAEDQAAAQITSLNTQVAKLQADAKKNATVIASLKRQLTEANAKLDKKPAGSATTVTGAQDKGNEYSGKKPVHSWEKKAAKKVGIKTEE